MSDAKIFEFKGGLRSDVEAWKKPLSLLLKWHEEREAQKRQVRTKGEKRLILVR
jgi:hypothetical protein